MSPHDRVLAGKALCHHVSTRRPVATWGPGPGPPGGSAERCARRLTGARPTPTTTGWRYLNKNTQRLDKMSSISSKMRKQPNEVLGEKLKKLCELLVEREKRKDQVNYPLRR